MERVLYADNFRGFSDAFIEFKQVNFFLGENSTGKTSILSAINLLSDMSFWFSEDFNRGDTNLGNFNDLVSIDSKDRSHFFIGYYVKVENKISIFRIAKFENREDVPYATISITFENGNLFYGIRKDKSILYKLTPKIKKNVFDLFKEVISNRNSPIDGLKEFNFGGKMVNFPFLLHAQTIIYEAEKKKSKSGIRFGFLSFANDPVWLAPIRTKPRRTYDEPIRNFTADGRHTPFLIRKKLSDKDSATKFKKLLIDIGKKGNLFKDLKIKSYGNDSSAPFQVQIILNKEPLGIHNVGYGVSQSLPVIVEMLCHSKGDSFIIQQPEVHLHPKAQAAIGELVYHLAHENKTLFFIETHSDYLIDRFRIKMRDETNKVPSQVLFFQRKGDGNFVSSISINEKGEYSKEQPNEFREFFIAEEFSKLGL